MEVSKAPKHNLLKRSGIIFASVLLILLGYVCLQTFSTAKNNLVTTTHAGPNTADPEARELYNINRSHLDWKGLKVEYTLERQMTPEFYLQEKTSIQDSTDILEKKETDQLDPSIRKSLEKEVSYLGAEQYDADRAVETRIHSFARQGANIRISDTHQPEQGKSSSPIMSYNGSIYKRTYLEGRNIWFEKESSGFNWDLPPLAGRQNDFKNLFINPMDQPFLEEPTGIELVPPHEHQSDGLIKYRTVNIHDANIYRINATEHHITEVTVDPRQGHAIVHIRLLIEKHFPNGVVLDPLPRMDLKVTQLSEFNGTYYPIAYEKIWYGHRPIEPISTRQKLQAMINVNKSIEFVSRPEEAFPVHIDRFTATSVQINETLVPSEVDIALKEGMKIYDMVHEPNLAYTFKSNFSQEEWNDIVGQGLKRAKEKEHVNRIQRALINQPAPPIKAAQWLNSEPLNWSQLRGKKVLLVFFSHWCGPCKQYMPDLVVLQDKFVGDTLAVIGIHTAESDAMRVEKLSKEFGLNYPIAITSSASDSTWLSFGETFDDYGVRGIPRICLIDEEGKVQKFGQFLHLLEELGLHHEIQRELRLRQEDDR